MLLSHILKRVIRIGCLTVLDPSGRQHVFGPGGKPEVTGIVIDEPTVASLCDAITFACRLYREPVAWRRVQAQAMRKDFSWSRSAERYLSVSSAPAVGETRSPGARPLLPNCG